LGFLEGMSAVAWGAKAGFQMRFVLPAAPPLAMLAAKAIVHARDDNDLQHYSPAQSATVIIQTNDDGSSCSNSNNNNIRASSHRRRGSRHLFGRDSGRGGSGSGSSSGVAVPGAAAAALLCIGAMHCFYYGILFAPLFADLGGSSPESGGPYTVWSAANVAMRSAPLSYPMPDELQKGIPLLAHYGIQLGGQE
jgi:hypothetical protein